MTEYRHVVKCILLLKSRRYTYKVLRKLMSPLYFGIHNHSLMCQKIVFLYLIQLLVCDDASTKVFFFLSHSANKNNSWKKSEQTSIFKTLFLSEHKTFLLRSACIFWLKIHSFSIIQKERSQYNTTIAETLDGSTFY